MSVRSRRLMRVVLGVVVAVMTHAVPGHADRPAAIHERAAAQCVLEPGVYGIVDTSGSLVGILIVYPDCRLEVFRKVEPE